ncbi:MAG TPA: TIGR01458 family HAD-type hydrolase [Kiloniellaceae bacterium]|nr:TIGR01458 family HAD-type hydrolase [Kiloniellaceae bacterium]
MPLGVLLDIAGVLYDGDEAVLGAAQAVSRLHKASVPVRYITNSTRRPKRRIQKQLASFGIAADLSEISTPAEVASAWLRQHGLAPHLLIHPDLEEDFAELPESDKLAVVVGDAGPYFTYERMNAAYRALMAGAPFLALAANRVFKDADGELSLDAGAFVRALEFASGIDATVLGKPSKDFFQGAADSMGCKASEVVMVGDDAESDVAGALAAGIGEALLVKTGKYRDGDESRHRPAPTAVVADIADAVALILDRHA